MEDFYTSKLKNEKSNNKKKAIESKRDEYTRLLKEKLADPDKAAPQNLQQLKNDIIGLYPNKVSVIFFAFL